MKKRKKMVTDHDLTKEEVQEIIEREADGKARDTVMLTEILISQVGKEKTKELVKKVRTDYFHNLGREAAEKLGNPPDLDSFAEAFLSWMKTIKWVPLPDTIERTPKRLVLRATNYCPGTALVKAAAGDEGLLEVFGESYCIHDIAFAEGFNPRIKTRINKTYFRGDDYCEIVWELQD